MNRFWLLIPVCFVLINCISSFAQTAAYSPIDKKASSETKALYKNLHALAEKHILFGHQHATEYGHDWYGDSGRSDVKSVKALKSADIKLSYVLIWRNDSRSPTPDFIKFYNDPYTLFENDLKGVYK